jgi:hypothetical protein
MSKTKRKSPSSTPQESEQMERLEVHLGQTVLAAASREAALWGLSLEDFVRASIAGSLTITKEEKELFTRLTGVLRTLSRELVSLPFASPVPRPGEPQALLQPIARPATKGDRAPLIQALRRVQELASALSSLKSQTPTQQELLREVLLSARRASRLAGRILAGEQPRTDLMRALVGALWIIKFCLPPARK